MKVDKIFFSAWPFLFWDGLILRLQATSNLNHPFRCDVIKHRMLRSVHPCIQILFHRHFTIFCTRTSIIESETLEKIKIEFEKSFLNLQNQILRARAMHFAVSLLFNVPKQWYIKRYSLDLIETVSCYYIWTLNIYPNTLD
jgi:hypothetical protein